MVSMKTKDDHSNRLLQHLLWLMNVSVSATFTLILHLLKSPKCSQLMRLNQNSKAVSQRTLTLTQGRCLIPRYSKNIVEAALTRSLTHCSFRMQISTSSNCSVTHSLVGLYFEVSAFLELMPIFVPAEGRARAPRRLALQVQLVSFH